MKKIFYVIFFLLTILVVGFIYFKVLTKPSNTRAWTDDQSILPYAEINDHLVNIHNIRNFKYDSDTSYVKNYYDKTFDLNKLEKIWYIVVPFSGIPGSAHTFLSFEFEDDEFVSISVEIRKEKGESFGPIKGLFNKYEIMYVIADEKDVVKLRTNYRKDKVYAYPVKTTKEKAQSLFLEMINRANELSIKPEFYNTLINTCTSNIVSHVNKVTPDRVPFFNLKILFPANSDKLANELGLLDIPSSFTSFEEEVRPKYFISEKAIKYADDPEFSKRIRE